VRVDRPDQLPPAAGVRLLLVDWGSRDPSWAEAIRRWRDDAAGPVANTTIVVFGPHTDLEAHAAAREAGIGPMKARSALFAALPGMLAEGG
jgi:hypothetical protein